VQEGSDRVSVPAAPAQSPGDLSGVIPVLAWMAIPVLIGWLSWQGGLRRVANGARVAAATSHWLSRGVLLLLSPVLMVALFWASALPVGQAVLLPLVGLFGNLFGGALGYAAARIRGLDRGARGAYFLCGLCSNILSFGGITTLFLVAPRHPDGAEGALGILALYRLFETPVYFLFGWPLFAMFAPADDGRPVGWWSTFRRGFRPVTVAPIVGIIVGCVLNASGASVPAWLGSLIAPLVKTTTVAIGLVVGLTLRAASPRKHIATCLTVAGIKFLLVPVATVTLAWLLGLRGPTLAVVLICSSMPLANFAVVGAAYYRLEEDRVAAVWVFTMALMPIVVSMLAILVGMMV
jgi:predicted permease